MGKKGTKRKTQWRTLSITECPPQNLKSALAKQQLKDKNSVNATNTTETNNNEGAISQDDDCSIHESSFSNPTYLKRKSSTSPIYRNDYRNNSRYSYNSKHNSASSTSSLHSSSLYTAYRRRPFSSLQNGSPRYSSYGAERTYGRGHRSEFSTSNRDTGDPTKKLPFNEDDYTRISTPRQDVIFKKGCFSQPRKYVSSTDTNTTSSAAASIVSAEESVSALSIPSLSPEQCSSVADSLDPEQGFVYSFIDQNGVVYSYVPNGFDQYNGQMMMLPCGYSPYMCSPDVTSPTGSSEENKPNQLTSESEEIPTSDLNETKVIEEVPTDASNSTKASSEETLNMQDTNDNKEVKESEMEATVTQSEAAPEKDEVNEEIKENNENSDAAQNIPEQFYNYGYPPAYYPQQLLYPYMIPQQFVPVFGNEFDIPAEEEYNEEIEDQNRIRYRCRKKRRNTEGNSTGVSATTTDYSEEESDQDTSVTENTNSRISLEQSDEKEESALSTQSHETDQERMALNVNVKEFVPRATKSSLNVDVKEFLPRTHQDSVGDVPKGTSLKYNKEINYRATENKMDTNKSPIEGTSTSKEKRCEKKHSELTLAEKIRKSMAEEGTLAEHKTANLPRALPQRKNGKGSAGGKTSSFTNKNSKGRTKAEKIARDKPQQSQQATVAQCSQLSYAQIANTGISEGRKISSGEEGTKVIASTSDEQKPSLPADHVNATKPAMSSASLPEIVTSDSWQTVKPRGKRSKYTKEISIEETCIADSLHQPESVQAGEAEIVTPIVAISPEISVAEPVVETIVPSNEILATPVAKVSEADTKASSVAKKTPRNKNRKNARKAADTSSKKKKKIEILEPVFELPKTELSKPHLAPFEVSLQDELTKANNESDVDTTEDNEEQQEEVAYRSGDSNFSFDQLYLGKGFGRNPMDILKGFDYKYMSKSILKEEEEMVLSVIKSLNNSSSSSPPKVSPVSSIVDDEDIDDKTIEENNKFDTQDSGSDADTLSELSLVGSCQNICQSNEGDEPESEECDDAIDVKVDSNTKSDCPEEIEGSEADFIASDSHVEDLKSENQVDSLGYAKHTENAAPHDDLADEGEIRQESAQNDVNFNKSSTGTTHGAEEPEEAEHTAENAAVDFSECLRVVLQPSQTEMPVTANIHNYTNGYGKADQTENESNHISIITSEDYLSAQSNIQKLPESNELPIAEDYNEHFEIKIEPLPKQIHQDVYRGVSMISQETVEKTEHGINPAESLELVNGNQKKTKIASQEHMENTYAGCNGKLNNGIEDKRVEYLSREEIDKCDSILENGNSTPDFRTTVAFSAKPERTTSLDEFPLMDKNTTAPYSTDHPLQYPLCESKVDDKLPHNLALSMNRNEELLAELDKISLPKIDCKYENDDYIACVNALNFIIRSRECSLEPETNHDVSLKSSEEPFLDLDTGPAMSGNMFEDLNQSQEDTTIQLKSACDNGILENGFGRKELDSTESSDNERTDPPCTQQSDASPLIAAEFDAAERKASIKLDDCSIDLKKGGLNGITSISELYLENIEKASSRVLNTSISCDHSSGIGSDCEDNQLTSPGKVHSEEHSQIMPGAVSTIAQIEDKADTKLLFPTNTTTVSKDTCLPDAKDMSINVLPTYSQKNSVSCDNQTVSYTSSNNSFDANVNPSLATTVPALDESEVNQLESFPKFPRHSDGQTNRFPLTEAVKQWLVEESKEPSPEPLFRIPEDPAVKVLVERQLKSVVLAEENQWTTTDESEGDDDYNDHEYEEDEADYMQKHRTKPKNLKSNPLRVSSCNATAVESDSDYNSDEHHCLGRNDDNTCKRVAETLSDKPDNMLDKNDLLEYWDDEFASNPNKWLRPADPASGPNMCATDGLIRSARSPSTDLEPYQSVYGETIDYNQLKANNYESLSNNILSISKNDETKAKTTSSHNYRAAIEEANESQQPLGSGTFYNNNAILRNTSSTTNITSTAASRNASQPKPGHENCLKPPEVCCVLM